jgi:hypothetical protein
MDDLGTIVILNHIKRRREGLAFQKLLSRQAAPLGVSVKISYDDGSLGLWGNYKQALTMEPDKPEKWRMVIHDDIMVGRSGLSKILHVLSHAPETFINFYNPDNKSYFEAIEKGRHVIRTHTNFWCQCLLTPTAIVDDMLEWIDRKVALDYLWEDRRLCLYMEEFDIPVMVIVPGLVQHLGAFRSTFGIAGKVFKIKRYSASFDASFDVEAVDWPSHFGSPYASELKERDPHLVKAQEAARLAYEMEGVSE